MSHHDANKSTGMPSADRSGKSLHSHVLLIEDDDVMREMLAETLRREGYRVTESEKALPWLLFCVHNSANGNRDQGYDVIVSDIRMPKIGGLDVLRILHDIHCGEVCPPIIFITAFGDEETHRTAKQLGAVAVLDKPFQLSEFIEKVREVVLP